MPFHLVQEWQSPGSSSRLPPDEGCKHFLKVVRSLFVMWLLVDAVETRHRWLLSATYAAAGKRATNKSVAIVSRTLFFQRVSPGVLSRDLFCLRNPPYVFVLPGVLEGALTNDITVAMGH